MLTQNFSPVCWGKLHASPHRFRVDGGMDAIFSRIREKVARMDGCEQRNKNVDARLGKPTPLPLIICLSPAAGRRQLHDAFTPGRPATIASESAQGN
jgi:hypothetical protein